MLIQVKSSSAGFVPMMMCIDPTQFTSAAEIKDFASAATLAGFILGGFKAQDEISKVIADRTVKQL